MFRLFIFMHLTCARNFFLTYFKFMRKQNINLSAAKKTSSSGKTECIRSGTNIKVSQVKNEGGTDGSKIEIEWTE